MEPRLGNKYYKLFIAFRDPDLVKYSNYIKFSKVLSTIECVKCFIN